MGINEIKAQFDSKYVNPFHNYFSLFTLHFSFFTLIRHKNTPAFYTGATIEITPLWIFIANNIFFFYG